MVKKAAKTAPRQRALDTETRNDKFRRLGKARITRALNALRLIGNLASSNYDYGPEEVEQIRVTIQATLDEAMSKFVKHRGKHTLSFDFTKGVEVK